MDYFLISYRPTRGSAYRPIGRDTSKYVRFNSLPRREMISTSGRAPAPSPPWCSSVRVEQSTLRRFSTLGTLVVSSSFSSFFSSWRRSELGLDSRFRLPALPTALTKGPWEQPNPAETMGSGSCSGSPWLGRDIWDDPAGDSRMTAEQTVVRS